MRDRAKARVCQLSRTCENIWYLIAVSVGIVLPVMALIPDHMPSIVIAAFLLCIFLWSGYKVSLHISCIERELDRMIENTDKQMTASLEGWLSYSIDKPLWKIIFS